MTDDPSADRERGALSAWGCTIALVGVYGGLFGFLAGIAALATRPAAADAGPLLVPFPVAVGATCVLATLVYFLLVIRPWQRRSPSDRPADRT